MVYSCSPGSQSGINSGAARSREPQPESPSAALDSDLVGRSMGEVRSIAPFAALIADLDPERRGIDAGVYITAESDFGQPVADDFGQERSNIAVNAVLRLTEEQMGRFQCVIQHPNVG